MKFRIVQEVNPGIKRWCRKCHITNREVKFFSGLLKNKFGRKRYYFNICIPCKKEERRIQKRRHYRKNRLKLISYSLKWNNKHRSRIRMLARERRKRNRILTASVFNRETTVNF